MKNSELLRLLEVKLVSNSTRIRDLEQEVARLKMKLVKYESEAKAEKLEQKLT